MAHIIVLDTETTGLDKPFCYDLGYVVMDTESFELVDCKSYVIEQVWHNLPLFESAYYKEKRPKYVQMMRTRSAELIKWGNAMRNLKQDIKKYDVQAVYAYNSDFDEKVITYNCDWFKTINPLENVPVYDIWGYASQFITNQNDYQVFCEKHERFTDSGNYKGSAEVVYQFLKKEPDFIEEHMGLFDAEIEAYILGWCIDFYGAEWNQHYDVIRILSRVQEKPFEIKINGQVVISGEYLKKYVRKDVYNFTVRE